MCIVRQRRRSAPERGLRARIRLAATESDKINPTVARAIPTGILYTSSSSIFTPMNIRITANPYLSMWKRYAISASRKYIARSPRIANMFEVKTIKGSLVTANIAGIESTAKMRSVTSTSTSTTNIGVA